MFIPAARRFLADHGWLQSQFLFSFAHHVDPDNIQFGPLRVFNDDLIAPRAGYPLHPHTEVEIVTLVLDGTLTHSDSLGNQVSARAGEVLRLTGGTGYQHSEVNRGPAEVHLYQIWLVPGQAGLSAAFEHKALDFLTSRNEWSPVASGRGDGGVRAAFLNADVTIWWANLDVGSALTYVADENRQLFLYVAAGSLRLNGRLLETNDQARLTNEQQLTLGATAPASVVLIDMP